MKLRNPNTQYTLHCGRFFLHIAKNLVARDGIEPPTPAFSGLRHRVTH
jgi:hypothetical protein